MTNIPTAKKFLEDCFKSHGDITPSDLIEFANLHCKAQQISILEKVKTTKKKIPYTGVRIGGSYFVEVIDKNSILKAYPLTNIK